MFPRHKDIEKVRHRKGIEEEDEKKDNFMLNYLIRISMAPFHINIYFHFENDSIYSFRFIQFLFEQDKLVL